MPDADSGTNPSENSATNPAAQSSSTPVLPMSPQQAHLGTTPNKETADNQNEAHKVARELHWLEKLNYAGQIALVGVGITALCVYRGQLKVMQGTLDEMKSSGQSATIQADRVIKNMNWLAQEMHYSVEESRSSIESSQRQNQEAIRAAQEQNRPWIQVVDIRPRNSDTGLSLSFTRTQPLHDINFQTFFFGDLTIRNVGHSVATNTTIGYELILSKRGLYDVDDVMKEQRKYCKSFLNDPTEHIYAGVLVFPDEPYVTDIAERALIRRENIGHGDSGGQYIRAAVVGCVNYQSNFSAKIYQSGFMFDIAHAEDKGAGYESFEIGRDVSMKELTLIRVEAADYAK